MYTIDFENYVAKSGVEYERAVIYDPEQEKRFVIYDLDIVRPLTRFVREGKRK